jgi:hypothetical protein
VPQRGRGRLEHVGEQVASCPLGQILIRGADRLLWTVEASVQWFVESKEPEKNDSSKKGGRERKFPYRRQTPRTFLDIELGETATG